MRRFLSGGTGVARGELVEISFDVFGQKQLSRVLGLWAANVKDLRGVWPDIRDDFLKNQAKQFATQGRHGSVHRVFFGLFKSQGWAPLSPAYAAYKALKWGNKGILVASGRLEDSLTQATHPDFIYKPKKKSVTLGTKVPYASLHQTGTRQMPQRPPIELVESQKRRWPKLMHEYIFKSGQGFGKSSMGGMLDRVRL